MHKILFGFGSMNNSEKCNITKKDSEKSNLTKNNSGESFEKSKDLSKNEYKIMSFVNENSIQRRVTENKIPRTITDLTLDVIIKPRALKFPDVNSNIHSVAQESTRMPNLQESLEMLNRIHPATLQSINQKYKIQNPGAEIILERMKDYVRISTFVIQKHNPKVRIWSNETFLTHIHKLPKKLSITSKTNIELSCEDTLIKGLVEEEEFVSTFLYISIFMNPGFSVDSFNRMEFEERTKKFLKKLSNRMNDSEMHRIRKNIDFVIKIFTFKDVLNKMKIENGFYEMRGCYPDGSRVYLNLVGMFPNIKPTEHGISSPPYYSIKIRRPAKLSFAELLIKYCNV